MTVEDLITAEVQVEGGYVDDPADGGGPTKYGVTLAALSAWRKAPCAAADVQALTVAEAEEILTRVYVVDPGFDKINDDFLRANVVDACIQHGPTRPTEWLQKVLGVTVDGAFGPDTAAAANVYGSLGGLAAKFIAARVRFYGQIVSGDMSQAKFDAGWMNRVAAFIEQLT